MEGDEKNDWGLYLRKKEETNKLLDQQLNRKSQENKKAYKQELDLQSSLKTQEKLLQNEQKKNEHLLIDLKSKQIQSEESKKRQEKFEMQKFLAKQYEFQSNYLKNKQKLENLSKIEEEKRKLTQIESQLLKDSESRKEQKLKLMKQAQESLKFKEFLKKKESESLTQEKIKDLHFLNLRAEQDVQRDVKQREFLKKKEDQQDSLQKMYLSHVSPQLSEKSRKIDMWVQKSVEDQGKALQAKETYEERIRKETMKNMKLVWNYQIQEKNERLKKIKEEQINIFHNIQNQVLESRKADLLRDAQKRDLQTNYRDFLNNQSGSARRNSSGSFEQISPSSYHGRSSSIAPRGYPGSPKDSQSSGVSFVSYHNPITNPIGDSPPRPINRPFYRPHTLISI